MASVIASNQGKPTLNKTNSQVPRGVSSGGMSVPTRAHCLLNPLTGWRHLRPPQDEIGFLPPTFVPWRPLRRMAASFIDVNAKSGCSILRSTPAGHIWLRLDNGSWTCSTVNGPRRPGVAQRREPPIIARGAFPSRASRCLGFTWSAVEAHSPRQHGRPRGFFPSASNAYYRLFIGHVNVMHYCWTKSQFNVGKKFSSGLLLHSPNKYS